MLKKNITLALLFTVTLSLVPNLMAQATDADNNNVENSSNNKGKKPRRKGDDEEKTLLIEVTSNKRKENIQDVPAAVSAFNGQDLEDRKVEKASDVATLVPNYSVGDFTNGFSYHSIRGESNNAQQSNPIGIYVDDVPITAYTADYMGMNPELFDLERVEVLRGAQGNLYGLNSAAGVINIITHKPQNYWEGKATAGFGNYDLRNFKASVGGPIVKDKLYVQVSGVYKSQDAYIEKVNSDRLTISRAGMRVQLIYTPLERLELALRTQINDGKQDTDGNVVKDMFDSNWKTPASEFPDDIRNFSSLSSFHIKYHHDVFELNSITSFKYSSFSQKVDMTRYGISATGMYYIPASNTTYNKTIVADYDMDGTQVWTQEVRFVSKGDTALKWLTGIFYSHAKSEMDVQWYPVEIKNRKETVDDFALFGQVSYTFIKKITLGASLRYDLDHKSLDYYGTLVSGNGTTLNPTTIYDVDDKKIWHNVSPKFTFDYRAHPSALIYVSVARGVKNAMYLGEISNADSYLLDPEGVWTYEGGLKTNFYNNRIFFNINGFYTQMRNVQIFYIKNFAYHYENAGKAHSAGTELEFALKIRGFDMSLTGGYLYTAFTKHTDSSKTGNKLPYAPVYTVGLWMQYTSPIGIYLGFGVNVNGKTFFDDNNKYYQKDYALIKGKIGYMSNHFSVDLWMENMANQFYWNNLSDWGANIVGVPGSPRTFGMSVSGYF